jgi:hypothetical protein
MGLLESIKNIGPLPANFSEVALPPKDRPAGYGVNSIALNIPASEIINGQHGLLQRVMDSTGWSKAGTNLSAHPPYILLERSRTDANDYSRDVGL